MACRCVLYDCTGVMSSAEACPQQKHVQHKRVHDSTKCFVNYCKHDAFYMMWFHSYNTFGCFQIWSRTWRLWRRGYTASRRAWRHRRSIATGRLTSSTPRFSSTRSEKELCTLFVVKRCCSDVTAPVFAPNQCIADRKFNKSQCQLQVLQYSWRSQYSLHWTAEPINDTLQFCADVLQLALVQ